MKFGKIIFLIIILIVSMSFVSASDNSTDNALETDLNSAIQGDVSDVSKDTDIASEINVTFDEKVYKENLTEITVDLPEAAQGNLEVKINDYSIYNETITNKTVVIPIQLPPQKFPIIIPNIWPPYDTTTYKVSAFYNGVDVNVTHDLIVMMYPKDYAPMFTVPEEVLQSSDNFRFMPTILFPRSATGTVEIYLDGKLINVANVTGPFVYFNQSLITSLSLGFHNLSYIYTGDDYYNPCNGSLMFNVTNAVINIPKSVYLDHDDCISVYTNVGGYVSVYIDSKLVKKQALDENGEFLYSLFKDITCGPHEIKVVVETKKFTRTKILNVNTTYSIDMYSYGTYRYGEDNVIGVLIPEDMDVKLFKVTINNETVSVKKSGQDLLIDISKLPAGNYTINVTYVGDKKYYPISINDTFDISYGIDVPYWIQFADNSHVDIILPTDANGSLDVYLNGVLYKSSKLVNGKASIMLNNLKPGNYLIEASYSGSDYNVSGRIENVTAEPDITYESYVHIGDTNILKFEVPKNCKGKITAKIGSKTYTATIKNGLATLDLSNLGVGDWEFDINYVGEDGFNDSYYAGVYVDYAPIKIKAGSTSLLYGVGVYTVKVIGKTGKVVKNGVVTFKVNGKKVKSVKTNSKGIAQFKLPAKYAPKKYTITAVYKTTKMSKKVTVKHLLSLKTSKIKKSSKMVLKAKLKKALKGKKIIFKFNGKKYVAKTNKNGLAKVTIKKSMLKNLKVGKRVVYQAAYLKDVVKKSAKVRK